MVYWYNNIKMSTVSPEALIEKQSINKYFVLKGKRHKYPENVKIKICSAAVDNQLSVDIGRAVCYKTVSVTFH